MLALALQRLLFPGAIYAHPPSGIVVDARGHVYFLFHGLVRIESSGKITTIQEGSGGHWLTIDAGDRFSRVAPVSYNRIALNGSTFVFGDGAPLVIGFDGELYYASNGSQAESFPTGAMTVVRFSPSGQRVVFSPVLKQELADLKDGITGLATGSDGSIYVATWNGILKLDCDSDPADHNPANASSPLLRGLGVDSIGNVYVAATSCHRVLKIAPNGHVESILKSERPWPPTGIAVSESYLYVLEYTNANGPRTEGWFPRVRQRMRDGEWKTLVAISP